MVRKIVVGFLPALFLASLFATNAIDRAGAADAAAPAAKEKKAPKKAARGPLPAYYDDLVNGEQRDRIYAIQKEHGAEIRKLNAALNEAKAKRDAAIEAVLRPEQKEKLAKLQAEAKTNKAKAAMDKNDKDAKPAEAAAAPEAAKPAAVATPEAPAAGKSS